MKKLLFSALIAAMVLGIGGTAFAATWTGSFVVPAFSDIAGHEAAHDLSALAALGIYEGSSGAARPDDPITRAEFCKVLVTALNRGTTAAGLAGLQPTFADGATIPSWAWGFVNVANYMGIMNGYADGSFKPNNPVTYAEAVTMLVRSIPGHLKQVTPGVWPYNFLFYGVDNNFTGDVEVGFANMPATRGDVARMVFATMFVETLNKDGEDNGGELLEGRYHHDSLNAYDLGVGTVNAHNLGAKVYLFGGANLEALKNLDCEYIANTAATKILFIAPYEATNAVKGVFDDWGLNDATPAHQILVLDDETEVLYDGTSLVTTLLNGATGHSETDLLAGDGVTITLDENSHAVNIVATREDQVYDVVVSVTAHKTTDPAGTNGKITLVTHGAQWVATNASITLNGNAAALADLKANDVLFVGTAGADGLTVNFWSVRAVRSTAEGTKDSERTVFAGATHKHYVTLKLADGTKKEYRVLTNTDGGAPHFNYGDPPTISVGKFALDDNGAICYAISYTTPTPYVRVKSYTAAGTLFTVTVDMGGSDVTYAIRQTLAGTPDVNFPALGYMGKLGVLAIDGPTNLVTGFVEFSSDGFGEILAVDAVAETITFSADGVGILFYDAPPAVYLKDTSAGTTTYVPFDQIQLWDNAVGNCTSLTYDGELIYVVVP